MNKIAYLFIIVLASCQFIPVQTNMTSIPPIRDVLEFSEKCPHLCWLGINPGTTTTEQATVWLRSSDQIDQKTAQISEASFLATWFPGKQVNNPCVLEVDFEAGLVKSITLGSLLYTVDDVISAFGPPDEISVTEIKAEGSFLTYSIYWNSKKMEIVVHTGGQNGPAPNDLVLQLSLNTDFYEANHPESWGKPQRWIGYGHIKDYLPGVEIPPTNQP